MKPLLPSLTLVAVVGSAVPQAGVLLGFAGALARDVRDVELVLVANGGDGAAPDRALKALVAAVPDLTVVFLAERVHDDMARLVGIEHAVGDYVLFCDLLLGRPAELPALLALLREGYDLVVADRSSGDPAPPFRRWAARAYCASYGAVTGAALDLAPTGLRVFSRAAALYVAGFADAALRLRARSVGPSFPAAAVALPQLTAAPDRQRRHGWTDGLGLLLSASAVPLRGATYAALLGGGLSALYSLYVFAMFLFSPGVAAGWTTLSLQLSGMMFVFSVVLLFLSEYVIQIHAGSAPRSRRFLVARELRSPLSRRTSLLNVVDAEGTFQMGKPSWLDQPA